MRISDWSSDVCSSDLIVRAGNRTTVYVGEAVNLKRRFGNYRRPGATQQTSLRLNALLIEAIGQCGAITVDIAYQDIGLNIGGVAMDARSEEHTSELQSLMRISYAVLCLKKKNNHKQQNET